MSLCGLDLFQNVPIMVKLSHLHTLNDISVRNEACAPDDWTKFLKKKKTCARSPVSFET